MDKLLAHHVLAALVGVGLSCCAPPPQTSSETHFVTCVVDDDCVVLGAGYSCVSGVCQLPAASPSYDAGPDARASGRGGGGSSAGSPGRDASEDGASSTEDAAVPAEAGNPGSDHVDADPADASPDAAMHAPGWEGERIVSVGVSGGIISTGPQRVGVAPDDLDASLARLVDVGRISKSNDAPAVYSSPTLVIPLGADAGWEAAVFDHFQALVRTVVTKLRRDPRDAEHQAFTGGSTYTFVVWPGHPCYEEARQELAVSRERGTALRARIDAYNAEHRIPASHLKIIAYHGQCIVAEDDDQS